jgi:hypothetical protein
MRCAVPDGGFEIGAHALAETAPPGARPACHRASVLEVSVLLNQFRECLSL